MRKILARVELHENYKGEKIPAEEYTKLHDLMYEMKYYKYIQDEVSRNIYELPPAEYARYFYTDVKIAINEIQSKLKVLNRKVSLLVSDCNSTRWDNLDEVKNYNETE